MIGSIIDQLLRSDLHPASTTCATSRWFVAGGKANGALAAFAACILGWAPLEASAQVVLTGGLSVQMQVGNRTTTNGPKNNGGAQTLGANTTDCTASTIPINFGRITLTSTGGFPKGPGGQKLNIDADGSVLITCRPAGNPNGPGTSSVGIQLSSSHPLGPQYLMTLNNSASTQGITYNVYKNPSRLSGEAINPGGDTITATVQADSTQDITRVDLYGRVGVPLGPLSGGTYQDNLLVTLFF